MARLGLDSFSYNLHLEDPASPRDVFWFLEKVVGLGLDGCQIDPRHLSDWDEGLIRKVGEFCRDRGLYLELGTGGYGFEKLSRRLALARAAGARCLRTFCSGRRCDMSPAQIAELAADAAEGLRRLAGAAEAAGVPIALENHGVFTSGEIIAILDDVDSPYVRCCLDTANSLLVGEDPLECTRALAPYAAAVHLKDWIVRFEDGAPRWEDRILGQGEGKVAEVYRTLREANPDLPITIENPTWGSSRPVAPEDEERNVVSSVAFARRLESDA